jgi:hypothetical protein
VEVKTGVKYFCRYHPHMSSALSRTIFFLSIRALFAGRRLSAYDFSTGPWQPPTDLTQIRVPH